MAESFLNALAGGYGFGKQIKADRQNAQLAGLASQAYGAAPEQRQAIVQQAIGVSPEAGFALGQNLQSDEDRRNTTMVNMAHTLTNLPEEARPGVYQRMVPYLQRFGVTGLPMQYDQQTAPVIMQAAEAISSAALGTGATGVQSTFVDEAGNRVAIMRDGSTQVLGRNNASIRVLEQEGQLPYGVVTSGGAAGRVVPLGQGMGAQQAPAQPQGWQQTGPAMFVAADGQPIPPEDQAALLRAVQEAERTGGDVNVPASAPAPAPGALPPRLDYQNGGTVGPVRVPTSAEKAAAEAAARRRVELSTLPAELQMRTGAAVQQAGDIERAKTQAEREAGEPARQEKVRQALAKSENITRTIDDAIGRVGRLTTGFVGSMLDTVPGTPANDLRVTIDTIKANLAFDALQAMREASPTGGALGAVSERELGLLESAVASLDQSQTPEQMRDALQRVKQHYNNWRHAVQQADMQARSQVGSRSPAVAPAGGVDDLLSKYGIQ